MITVISTGHGPLDNSIAKTWVVSALATPQIGAHIMDGLESPCPFVFRTAAHFFYLTLPYTFCPEIQEDTKIVIHRLKRLAMGEEPFLEIWKNPLPVQQSLYQQINALDQRCRLLQADSPVPAPVCRNAYETLVAKAVMDHLGGPAEA